MKTDYIYKGQRDKALRDTDCFSVPELYQKCQFSGVYGQTTVYRFLSATKDSEPMRTESERNINQMIINAAKQENK